MCWALMEVSQPLFDARKARRQRNEQQVNLMNHAQVRKVWCGDLKEMRNETRLGAQSEAPPMIGCRCSSRIIDLLPACSNADPQ